MGHINVELSGGNRFRTQNKEWTFATMELSVSYCNCSGTVFATGVKTARCKRIILLRIGCKTIIKYAVNTALNQGSRKLFL